jgi:hypothetical protein
LVRSLEIVSVDEEFEAPREVGEVGKYGSGQKLVPRRLPKSLDLPERHWVLRSAANVVDALLTQQLLEGRLSPPGKGQRPEEKGPSDILALRRGIVVSDADTLFVEERRRDDIIDCGCNMHARRYFVKALDRGDSRAALALGAFKGLYQVEEEFRDASADERLAARQERSTPIYDDLVLWCRAHQPEVRPSEPLGRAIAYLLKHEVALRRFETDGAIPTDNIAAEHAFVPVGLTRKNFLFFGADKGGDRAAIVYTLLHCCQLAGVDPVAYLTDVLRVLGRGTDLEMAELMPARWKLRQNSS